MLRIWASGCLVWFSMFRTHSPLLSPLILRMLSLHANALFLVSKELSNTNQAILLRNCCTHSFGRRQVTAMRPHWIPYDRPHDHTPAADPTLRSFDMSPQNTSTEPHKEGTALSRAMRPVNHIVERFIPSSLVFSILLTFIVVILALILTDTSPGDLVVYWGDGLAGLLDFITQMALILLLGHILANTGPVRSGLSFLGSVPRTELAAYVFVFLVAAIASLITWGLGLVVGGLLAREVAYQGRERGLRLHFPMLVASGFAGFVVW